MITIKYIRLFEFPRIKIGKVIIAVHPVTIVCADLCQLLRTRTANRSRTCYKNNTNHSEQRVENQVQNLLP